MENELYEPIDGELIFEKKNPGDKVWWCYHYGSVGEVMISFDKNKTYDLFTDFGKLTAEQRIMFLKENPSWDKMF